MLNEKDSLKAKQEKEYGRIGNKDVLDSMHQSIQCGAITDNRALSIIITQLICSIYESYSEALNGILSLDSILKTGKQTKELTIKEYSIKGMRIDSAHGYFDIVDDKKLLFSWNKLTYEIELDNYWEALREYRIACSIPEIVFMVFYLESFI